MACTFARPFWAAYDVRGDTRTRKLGDGTVYNTGDSDAGILVDRGRLFHARRSFTV